MNDQSKHARAASLDRALQGATLHFTETWEDPRTDARALQVEPEHTVLAITAGGCTPLSLLTAQPTRLISVDYNPAQSQLLALKMAAIRRLPQSVVEPFLRLGRGARDVYPLLREDLDPSSRTFWDERTSALASGIAPSGLATQIFYRIGAFLGHAFKKPIREGFFAIDNLEAQAAYYRRYFHYPILRALTSLIGPLLSRPAAMRRLLPADYFPFATVPNIPAFLWRRIEHVMTRVPATDNYFMSRILLGHDLKTPGGTPPYLERAGFPAMRRCLDRVEIITAPIEQALADLDDHSIDRFQLSNVFEWMPETRLPNVFGEISRAARPGARIFFRNLFTARSIPDELTDQFQLDHALSASLRDNDRSLIYSQCAAVAVES